MFKFQELNLIIALTLKKVTIILRILGEVIYENNRITEWSKFYTLTGVGIYGFLGMFVPFSLIVKTHLPLLGAYDNLFLPYYNHSYFFFDNNALHIPTIAGVASYVAYYALVI